MPQVPLPTVADSTASRPQVTGPQGVVPLQDVAGQQTQRAGAALSKLGAATTAIAANINETHALATSKGGMNEFATHIGHKESTYRSRIGKAASEHDDDNKAKAGEAPKRVLTQMREKMLSIENGLSSDLAKRIFRTHAERSLVSVEGRMFAHEMKQIDVHDAAEDDAGLDRYFIGYITKGDGKNWWLDEDFVGAMTTAGSKADRAGMVEKARAAYFLKVKTGLHVGYASALLAQNTPKTTNEADEYLRSLDPSDINVLDRRDLRKKIDGVLRAGKNTRAAIDRLHRRDPKQPSPTKQRDMLQTEVIGQGTVLAPNWEESLSKPETLNNLSDGVMTIPIEIAQQRLNPNKRADNGVEFYRVMKELRADLDAGKITHEDYKAQRAEIVTEIRVMTQAHNAAATDTLKRIEQSMQGTRPGTNIASPSWQAKHPNLNQQATDLMIRSQALGLTDKKSQLVAREHFWAIKGTQAFKDMTYEEFYSTFRGRLSHADYVSYEAKWKSAHPDAKPLPDTLIENDVMQMLDEAGKLTGDADENGIRKPDNAAEHATVARVEQALRNMKAAGKSFPDQASLRKWVSQTVLGPKGMVKDPGKFYHSRIGKTKFQLDAEIRRAKALFDQSGSEAHKLALKKAETALELANWEVEVEGKKHYIAKTGNTLRGFYKSRDDAVLDKITPAQVDRMNDDIRIEMIEKMVAEGKATGAHLKHANKMLAEFRTDGIVSEEERTMIEHMFHGQGKNALNLEDLKFPSMSMQVGVWLETKAYEASAGHRAESKVRHRKRMKDSVAQMKALSKSNEEKNAFAANKVAWDKSQVESRKLEYVMEQNEIDSVNELDDNIAKYTKLVRAGKLKTAERLKKKIDKGFKRRDADRAKAKVIQDKADAKQAIKDKADKRTADFAEALEIPRLYAEMNSTRKPVTGQRKIEILKRLRELELKTDITKALQTLPPETTVDSPAFQAAFPILYQLVKAEAKRKVKAEAKRKAKAEAKRKSDAKQETAAQKKKRVAKEKKEKAEAKLKDPVERMKMGYHRRRKLRGDMIDRVVDAWDKPEPTKKAKKKKGK